MKRRNGWGWAACVLIAGLVAVPSPALAWQAFARITTSSGQVIAGDSTAKGFEKQIVVLGLGNQLTRGVSTDSSGGISLGKLAVGPLQLVKAFDIASPQLVVIAGNGQLLSKVEITLFKTTTTGTSVPGFRITLTNAFLSSMETTYDPGGTPSALEKLELHYQKMTWTDLITGASGSTP
jgi:type VI secretion system Hcp family effector